MAELTTQPARWRPGTLSDLAALLPRLPLRYWRALAAQVTAWPTLTLEAGGQPMALVTLVPEGDAMEACVVLPFDRPTGHATLRRLMFSAVGVMPHRQLIARISDRNRQSRRMAVMIGFQPTDQMLAGTDVRVWVRPPTAGNVTQPERG